MYSENYKTLRKDIPCSWVGKLCIVNVDFSWNWSTDSVFVKIPAGFFAEIVILVLKFIWKSGGPGIAKSVLKKEEIGEPCFLIQNVLQKLNNQDCGINRSVDMTSQWNKIEKYRNKPSHLWSVDFWQRYQDISREKE